MEIKTVEGAPGTARRLVLLGSVGLESLSDLRERLDEASAHGAVELDLAGVGGFVGGAAAVVAPRVKSGAVRVLNVPEAVSSVLDLYLARAAEPEMQAAPPLDLIPWLGEAANEYRERSMGMLAFLGELGRSTVQAIRRPSTVRWQDVSSLLARHGSDGLPINALIGFLMGLITAFQAAVQLRKFGADVFVADLVGLSLTRELGPLMMAIVLAGRSGAAISAELGTMKVGEEVDALRVMGLDPVRFLVLPRMIAVTAVAPILSIMSTMAGIFGGMLIADGLLGIPFSAFINSLEKALGFADVFTGIGKSLVFGFIVAMIASQRGLATRGGAEGVGRSTTAAVVTTLFTLIVADALFAILFNMWGI
jgi:phospholipid/cholesterol/gamma-HCH transport system permease protein